MCQPDLTMYSTASGMAKLYRYLNVWLVGQLSCTAAKPDHWIVQNARKTKAIKCLLTGSPLPHSLSTVLRNFNKSDKCMTKQKILLNTRSCHADLYRPANNSKTKSTEHIAY